MSKIIMHIDLNAFFATAEAIKDPSLEGKPLIVAGSSRRGIVSTASYEARKFGIHSAMPTYQAIRLCPDVIVCPGDFEWYHKLSSEFFDYVRTYTPIIEIASIDECYADMTECMKDVTDPEGYLRDLQNKLFEKTKLKCSIGLAPTKFLAKMASDMKKPMGVTIIRRKDVRKILWPVPIEDFYGIGKKTCPRLRALGINTIGDFVRSKNPELRSILGKGYDVFMNWANGYGSDEVITEETDPKSIGNSSTFLFDTSDYDDIKEKIFQLCQEVAMRAGKAEKIGKTVTVVIKSPDFKNTSKAKTMDAPSGSFEKIYHAAMEIYDTYFIGQNIRLVGVTLSHLSEKKDFHVQMTLFNMEQHREECATRLLINELNNKMKKPMLMRASDAKGKKEESK